LLLALRERLDVTLVVDRPSIERSKHTFVCGNDADAKARVAEILRGFGWENVVDLGTSWRRAGPSAYLLLWIPMMRAAGTPLNVKIVRLLVLRGSSR
jgi:predicted dinucleotide-binding enzyme